MIVIQPPVLHQHLGLLQCLEPLAIQQFILQLAVEAFAVGVLPRTARLDVQRAGSAFLQPCLHRRRDKLRTIVAADELRPPDPFRLGRRSRTAEPYWAGRITISWPF